MSNKTEIKLTIELDENRVPEKLVWSATEGGINEEEAKSFMLSVWDGNEKVIKELDAKQSFIWSSVTLYPELVINNRRKWFQNFNHNNIEINKPAILNFHRFAGEGDKANDVLMNRNNELFTVSITMLYRDQDISTMHYFDLRENEDFIEIADHSIPSTVIHESV